MDLTNLTKEESKWVSTILSSEEEAERMANDKSKSYSSYDISHLRRYSKLMRMVIENHNLVGDIEYDKDYYRVIRCKRTISVKDLERLNIEYVIFDGLYVIAKVRFIDSMKVKEFYTKPTRDTADKIGIGHLKTNLIKNVYFGDGVEHGVVVCDERLYGFIRYYNDWDYFIFKE